MILASFTVVPYFLTTVYLSKIPHLHLLFFIVLAFIKFFVLNEKNLEKKYRPIAQSQLAKELKRNASSKEIFNRIKFYIRSKDAVIILCALAVATIAIIFGKI